VAVPVPRQQPARDQQHRIEREKAEIPVGLIGALADVVAAEQMVVDETLGDVEEPPAEQHPAGEHAARADAHVRPRGPPEEPDADGSEDPRRRVEEPVGEGVRLEPGDGRLRIAALAREHVVPLQDLVQHDAVHEAAQPDAEHDAGRSGRSLERLRCAFCDGHAVGYPPMGFPHTD
jgi:hypothetical protein